MQYHTKTYSLVRTAVMTALLAVTAQIMVPNPFGVVPFSLAVFGVVLTGEILSPKSTLASIGAYLLLGLAGLPVFAGLQGGPQIIVGPTGGFLVGYLLLGLCVSFAARRQLPIMARIGVGTAGIAACYMCGLIWYAFSTKSSMFSGFFVCVAPFIIPDTVKITGAVLLASRLKKQLKAGRISI